MDYLKSHIRLWIFPTLATVGFLLLLMHESEFPAVFNRYSIDYTILLTLAAINLGLVWRRSVRRVSYQRLFRRFTGTGLVPLVILVPSVIFLIDFVTGIGLLFRPSYLLTTGLLGMLLLQAEALREQPPLISNHLALVASSLGLALIVVELTFVFFLLESRSPKSQHEFLRLMASSWPEPIAMSKPPGTFRILGLADSFGTAGGVISNYHYLLRDILRRDISPTIEVVNISVEGYDTIQELAILRYGLAYSPDVVLHGFFVGNDFAMYGDNADVYNFLAVPITRTLDVSPYRPRHFLSREWIRNALRALQEKRSRDRELQLGIVATVGEFSQAAFLQVQARRMRKWGRLTHEDVDRMKSIFPVLDAIRALAEEGGARYVMVIHPDQTQLDEKLRQEIITTYHVNKNEYDFDLPQKLLHSYCDKRGILCLDLLPSFRARAKDGDLYLPRDTHYNHAGNALAAAKIGQFLQRKVALSYNRR